MCCIISMLGRDAHMNAYLTHVEVIFFLSHWWIIIVHYNLKERIVKWTHEPRSTFYHKKHLYIAFILLFICCIILIRKYKNIYLSYLHPKPQKQSTFLLFLLSYFILSSFTYFITTCVLFTYAKPCAWQPHGRVGDTRLYFTLQDC